LTDLDGVLPIGGVLALKRWVAPPGNLGERRANSEIREKRLLLNVPAVQRFNLLAGRIV